MSARTAAAAALTGDFAAFSTKTKAELMAAFAPATFTVQAADWVGTYVDLFSPDYDTPEMMPWDNNAASRRFVGYDESASELFMSGDLADGNTWGKRFGDTGPTFVAQGEGHVEKMIDFAVMVPPDNVKYEGAQKGALQFQVTYGKAFGVDCMKWSGPYLGKGGVLAGLEIGAMETDNFLVKISSD